MDNRVSFYTLGCRLNQSETAALQHSFEFSGYHVVDFEEPADIVVVNTCTVTEHGDAETHRIVKKINRMNPGARIALIGCQAQTQKEKLLDLPNVCFVVGNARKMDLVEILSEAPSQPDRQPDRFGRGMLITPAIPRDAFTIPIAGIDRHHTRANLKIQDGCDFFCSFCEIPYARGRARSRIFADILVEARVLVASGHKELVLTGINLGTYRYEDRTIVDVIDALAAMEGLKRIRISSIEPTTIPWEIIQKMKKAAGAIDALPRLCRYLHIPLQSGSDRMLQFMQRKYDVQGFSDFIKQVHQMIPQICLGTDVIVGFPGETEEDFQQTYEVLCDLPFSYFHVFSYSARTMAKSRTFDDPVAASVIQKRSAILRELSIRKRRMFLQPLIGTQPEVLFEENKNGFWLGKTDHYATVKVRSGENLHNRILMVRLEKIDGQMVMGTLMP